MNSNAQIKILAAACILIVCTLSLIQYYLVKNTYQLTKDKYYAEVRTELAKITSTPASAAIEAKVLDNLKDISSKVVSGSLAEREFLKIAAIRNDSIIKFANVYFSAQIKHNAKLKGILYQSRYDQILLQINGKETTLLAEFDRPFVYVGSYTFGPNTLLLSRGNIQSFENNNVTALKHPSVNKISLLQIKGSQHIDVSCWKQEVIKRMAGIFTLASGLIIAVIILFYLVFSTMLRQKRIADIQTDFANNITHELKTPLTSVNLILKSLERIETQSNTDIFNELLQSLRRQYSKIQLIVDSVLESAMSTAQHIKLEKLDISEHLSQFVNDLRLMSHSLKINIAPSPKLLYIDTGALDKALNNLIDNAVKYSPEGTEIGINAYPEKDVYLIEISDEGSGIAQHQQSRIFDKFYRIDEHDHHTVKGLGLGLYLTMLAVTQLRGSIEVVSGPTKGTIFIIKLPQDES